MLYSIHHQVRKTLLAMAIALPMASCNTVWDDDNCPAETEYRVKFVHDYNMLFTDAFATQVHSVTLYAFDEQGKLVLQQSEQGEALSRDDYTMKLDLAPGNYRLVAWAGLAEGNAYEVPLLQESVSDIEDLTCRINRYRRTLHGEEIDSVGYLHPLWHGITEPQTLTRASVNTQTVTMPLVKNTNTIRVILQQLAQGQMDASQFEFTVTDENGMMTPRASVSGLMLAHPQARYFSVGHIGEDQLNDYAMRRGKSPDEMRKFLSGNLTQSITRS